MTKASLKEQLLEEIEQMPEPLLSQLLDSVNASGVHADKYMRASPLFVYGLGTVHFAVFIKKRYAEDDILEEESNIMKRYPKDKHSCDRLILCLLLPKFLRLMLKILGALMLVVAYLTMKS